VLLECPFTRVRGLMHTFVAHVQEHDFRVLLAHPERSPEFWSDPPMLGDLVARGSFVQITASSLRGDFGRTVRRFAIAMLDAGLVHVIASDAHDATSRSPEVLSIVREVVRDRALPSGITRFVTDDVPWALLTDEPLPPPPRPDPPPRWFPLSRR
jgi:protein-tyrosine phosphatase